MNTSDPLEANRQLMASINDEIWNQGNLDLIDERYAADYVRHEAGYPDEMQGSVGLKQFIAALRVGFPDWNCAIEQTLAVDDKVVVYYRCTGTQTGEWNGLAPSGKQIEFTDIIIHKIADGKVVEDWSEYDSLGWMQQLGFQLMPPPAATGTLQPTVLVKARTSAARMASRSGRMEISMLPVRNERAVLVVDQTRVQSSSDMGTRLGVLALMT
jgi:steroid delta-isomerase-like uncharacterized protein